MAPKYALMTSARNEEDYIGQTLQSVVEQSVLPRRWAIVDDGSTDGTGAIIASYASQYDFILPLAVAGDRQRNFGSKAKALAYAYQQMRAVDFDYIGNLDADIALDPTYYETILAKMEANPRLGLAGGVRYDVRAGKLDLRMTAANSVGGSYQLFRRACYEQFSGYVPMPYGGIDAVAEISARMCGWEVRSFPEVRLKHLRPTGTAGRSIWSALYRAGLRDYTVGYHPLFELMRIVPRMKDYPAVVGSWVTFAGYLSALVRRIDRPVPDELVSFLHREQMSRLKRALTRGPGSRGV